MDGQNQAPLQPILDSRLPWWRSLDVRETAQLLHARAYARDHAAAGAPGHGQFLLIAKLSQLLDDMVRTPATRPVVWDETSKSWRDVQTGVNVQVP